jgi:hypothetical protein
MKLALLIMLLAGSMFQAQQEHSPPLTQEEPKLCTISGRVVKRATGEPLKSARLLLSENVAGEGHEYAAFTDANGQFVIKNVVPGRYDFEAHHNGYVEQDYQRMRNHKWYMSGRMITVHDIYSFDPDAKVELEEFTDVIGRNFRQPEQGLGFDNSPVAHMWRAMIRPAKYL